MTTDNMSCHYCMSYIICMQTTTNYCCHSRVVHPIVFVLGTVPNRFATCCGAMRKSIDSPRLVCGRRESIDTTIISRAAICSQTSSHTALPCAHGFTHLMSIGVVRYFWPLNSIHNYAQLACVCLYECCIGDQFVVYKYQCVFAYVSM